MLHKSERYQEAIKYYKRSIELAPINIDNKIGLASTFKAIGNPADAEKIYLDILKTDKEHLISLINLSNIYIQKNDFESAKNLIETAISFHPNENNVYYTYGMLLIKAGRTESAIHQFVKAVKLSPNDIDSRNHIGVILS